MTTPDHQRQESDADSIARMFGFPACPPAVRPQIESFIAMLIAKEHMREIRQHPIREAIKKAARTHDLSNYSLRELAVLIGYPEAHPQSIKYHLSYLTRIQ